MLPREVQTVVVLLLTILPGCGGTPPPHGRMGGLPFPGAFTLYSTADPDKLGFHRYDQGLIPLPPYERDRGLIYTCKAGFLDIAHTRAAIDWTRYYADHVRDALKSEEKSLDVNGPNYSRFVFKFRYPDDWGKMDKQRRQWVIEELAVRIGQRAAYAAMTWHEVITWYGYKGSLIVDESPSSFTWDDVMSHVIGTRVGGQAWRAVNVPKQKEGDYNKVVTRVLSEELHALGAATKADQTTAAARAVEGRWWADGKPLRRQLEIGLTTGRVTPWLASGLSFCKDEPATPPVYLLPDLTDVDGRDFSGMYDLEIDSGILQMKKIRSKLPGKVKKVDVARHLPGLVETIRGEMRAKFGDGFDQP
jgi:hypothetical protein